MSTTEILEALAALSDKWMVRQSGVSALWEHIRTAVAGADHARAQQALEEILHVTPRDADAWHSLAVEFFQQQSSDAACDAILRMHPFAAIGLLRNRSLVTVAEVFSDTIHWSGANIANDAVATGLPVVTMPGEFMQGRHCYAFLKMLGLDELIAADKAEYVTIAAERI